MAVFDTELSAEVLKLFIFELSAIIDDDDLRKVELTDNKFSYEFSSLGLNDLGYPLSFHLFGELVDGYK